MRALPKRVHVRAPQGVSNGYIVTCDGCHHRRGGFVRWLRHDVVMSIAARHARSCPGLFKALIAVAKTCWACDGKRLRSGSCVVCDGKGWLSKQDDGPCRHLAVTCTRHGGNPWPCPTPQASCAPECRDCNELVDGA